MAPDFVLPIWKLTKKSDKEFFGNIVKKINKNPLFSGTKHNDWGIQYRNQIQEEKVGELSLSENKACIALM